MGTMHVPISAYFLMEVEKGLIPGHRLERKFGRNPDIDTAASEIIWANGGAYTFPSGAETLDVSSSDINDTAAGSGARTLELFGLDANYAEISETVALAGQSTVTTTNTFLRLYRAIVRTGVKNVGTITVQQTTSVTVVAGISPGISQTQLGVYTIPAGVTGYLLCVMVNATKGTSSGCEVDLFVRPFGEVFQLKGTYGCHSSSGTSVVPFLAPLVLPEKCDLCFEATVTANNTQVAVEFPMLLIDN